MRMQPSFPSRPAGSRLMLLFLAGAAIAMPVAPDFNHGAFPTLSPAFAHARGGDDSGGDNGGHGRGGDDNGGDGGGHGRGGDDSGGRGRGGDDRGSDDNGGRGRGGDDRGGDDNGGRGRGGDDRGGDRGRGRGSDDARNDDHGRGRGRDDGRNPGTVGDRTPARAESSSRGIEVTYADGWKEEVENGRYELKDARNRTVVERAATRQDYDRLGAIAR